MGRRYSLGLLSLVANSGIIRFNELQSRLGGVSSSTLAARLDDLQTAGLIARIVYPDTPPRVEYSLTDGGRELCGVLSDYLRRGRRMTKSVPRL
jgi:DNA-binding HxlR family transcriptional regulator